MLRVLTALVVAVAVITAGCSGGTEKSPDVSESATPTTTPEPSPTKSPTPRPTSTPAPTPPPPADPLASMFVNGFPPPQIGTIDEEEVGVVAHGDVQSSGVTAVLLRSNTTASVMNIGVSAIVRTADGSLLASGEDQGIAPEIVGPGEVAFGHVFLGSRLDVPAGSTIEFSVSWDEGENPDFLYPLQVTEVNVVQDRFVGIVYNPWNVEVSGPISVDFICLDEEGQPLSTEGTFADREPLQPEGTSGFQTLGFSSDPCPYFLVASRGFGY